MKTSEIKKGMKVRMRDGTVVEVMDNKRSRARSVKGPSVFGPDCEGEVPCWDWAEVINADGTTEPVELTEAELESQRLGDAMRPPSSE